MSLITVYPAHLERPLGQIGKKQMWEGPVVKMASLSWTGAMGTLNSKQRGRQKDSYPDHGPCTLHDGSQKGAVLLKTVKNRTLLLK